MNIRHIGSRVAGQNQTAWAAWRQSPLTNSAVKMDSGIWTMFWKKHDAKLPVITPCSKVGTRSTCPVPAFGSWMQTGRVCRPKHRFDWTDTTFRSWLDYKSFSWGLYGRKSFFSSEVILEQSIIILLLTSAGLGTSWNIPKVHTSKWHCDSG